MLNWGQIIRWLVGGAIVACLLILCVLMSGCKVAQAPVVVTAPSSHIERNDSTEKHYIHDTTYLERWHTKTQKGDTVYIYDSVYLYDGEKAADTIRIYKHETDTIPKIVEVEKQPTKNDVFLKRSGIALWVIVALLLLAVIIGIVIKFAK